jgi:hypothetical protein
VTSRDVCHVPVSTPRWMIQEPDSPGPESTLSFRDLSCATRWVCQKLLRKHRPQTFSHFRGILTVKAKSYKSTHAA